MQVIDLSVVINEQTPVYPGDPTPTIQQAGQFEKDGFVDHLLSMGTHVGTHIDAPLHMLEAGKSLADFPIERFVGRGRLIKVSSDFNIDTVRQANVQEGDIVLLYTGMSEHFNEPLYYEKYPVMSDEIAHYLVQKKVKMVGLDTGSADNLDGFPIHKILLSGNVLIIENLTNLLLLDGKAFTVYALPIKLELDGSPARVIAQVQ